VGDVNPSWRIGLVGMLLAAMLGLLGLRLWALQVTGVAEYQAKAESNQIRLVNTPAPRGNIFDRNGDLLAGTRPSLAVVVDMALVNDDSVDLLATNLAAFLDQPVSSLQETFANANSGAQLILATDLSEERALTLMEHSEDFPGVAVIPQPVREYPGGDLAAHVLGYIGRPSEEDLQRPDVKGNDVVGKAGVERYYDDVLRGTEGIVQYRVDASRTVLSKASEQSPRPGSNLYLTIDAGVQAQVQASLREGLELSRRLEMEERATALDNLDAAARMARARTDAADAIREATLRAATADDVEEPGSKAAALAELEALPKPDELTEGDVLGALYDGLPVDDTGVCVPTQRVTLILGQRSTLSGAIGRSIRLVSVADERSAERSAVIVVDGEQFVVREGDQFATTLQVLEVDPDRVVLTHSDKFCPVRSVAVVEDPRDGSIIAMASYPTYDPTAFVSGLTSEEWQRLGTANAFTNFAVQGLYAPASTFKVVAYMLAMEQGIYPLDRPVEDRVLGNENTSSEDGVAFAGDGPPVAALKPLTSDTDPYACTGSLRFEFNDGSSQVYRDWKRDGHGMLDLHGALESSCDLYFWEIALRIWNERADDNGINDENLWQEWARSFGFGSASGIDLPFEKEGLIPDRAWFREEQRAGTGRVRPNGPWVGGDLMNAVVGQGTVLVTPLQLANGFSAMVNGGTLWQPRVVDRITDQNGTRIRLTDGEGNAIGGDPEVIGTVPLSSKTVTSFRNDLERVVNGANGTARQAFESFGEGVELVGGKTGTAEIIKSDDPIGEVDTAWFVGVAPVYDPTFVVSVTVERGGSGGRVAAPIARQILQYLVGGPGAVTPLEAGAEAD
jgi:cell division protein FtsI/penicillin-binding protein 2